QRPKSGAPGGLAKRRKMCWWWRPGRSETRCRWRSCFPHPGGRSTTAFRYESHGSLARLQD
ncbi:unnamed protein product, partial [Ectocarpus sp. 12 AP-2014]